MMSDSARSAEPDAGPRVPHVRLWFGMLGGAVAWLVHLVVAYLIAEFGCLTRFGEQRLLGWTLVTWMVIAVTAATLLLALTATAVAYGQQRRVSAGASDTTLKAWLGAARIGGLASGFSALVILVETLPIVYYLRDC